MYSRDNELGSRTDIRVSGYSGFRLMVCRLTSQFSIVGKTSRGLRVRSLCSGMLVKKQFSLKIL